MAYMPKSAKLLDQPYMPKSATPEVPADTVAVTAHTRMKPRQDWRKRVGGALPTVGGMAGSLLGAAGGPAGEVGGAAAGGSLGETGSELLQGQPLNPGEIGKQGAIQGAYGLAGGIAGQGVKALGKLGVNLALKFTPEVAQTAIKEGITATKLGLEKLGARIRLAGGAERKIVANASHNGIGWRDPVSLARSAYADVASKLEGAPSSELSKLAKLQEDFIRDNPQDINPLNLLKKRQYYDNQAAVAHTALKKGAKAAEDVQDMWNRAMANRSREALQADIPTIVDPGAYEKLTGKATIPSELQKLREVVQPIVQRGGGLGARIAKRSALPVAGATIGAALPGNRAQHAFEGLVAGAALDPAIASTLGLHAQNPFLPIILQNAARLGGYGVQQASE